MHFRFVKEIVALNPGTSIEAKMSFSEMSWLFDDHFPSFSVVPGVLLSEMMQQTAAICVEARYPTYGKAVLVQIKNARFRDWVTPDQTIDVFASIKTANQKFSTANTRAIVGGVIVCSAEIISSWVAWEEVGLDPVHPLLSES